MDLITDHPRSRARPDERATVAVPLPGPGADRDALLAAFAALLYRYTGETDIDIAVAIEGLAVKDPAVESSAPGSRGQLRLPVDPSEPFGSLRARVATAGPLRVAGPSAGPAVAFADHDPPAGWGDLSPDLTLVLPAAGQVWLDYDSGLFDRATAVRMAKQLRRILQADPVTPVGVIDLMSADERIEVQDRFNDTGRPYPRDATVHQLFAAQAAATPDALAVGDDSGELSYAELDARAERLAGRLRAAGVRAGDPVGLLMGRTPAMVTAALGILKAGGAYLPIDVGYPPERIAFQLADSRATALVTDADGAAAVDFAGPVLVPDADSPDVTSPAAVNPHGDGATTATDTAYVMYTSGTTGRPKGVQVRHRGVVRLVRDTDYLTFGPDTRMLAISSICFDAATFELWGPLLNGGSVHLAGPDAVLDAGVLGRLLADRAISTLLLIAPVFNHLVEQDPTVFRSLRELMVGGDALSARHLAAVMDGCPDLVLINGYGPTENTTLGSTHRLGRADLARVPIGRPVANSRCYVLDPAGRLCPRRRSGPIRSGRAAS
jgi:amino acid adenylation domain-containing protein